MDSRWKKLFIAFVFAVILFLTLKILWLAHAPIIEVLEGISIKLTSEIMRLVGAK